MIIKSSSKMLKGELTIVNVFPSHRYPTGRKAGWKPIYEICSIFISVYLGINFLVNHKLK